MTYSSWSLDPLILKFISERLKDGSSVLEFGSGDSTSVLSEKYVVTSVEENIEYIGVHPKATYIHAIIDPDTKWYSRNTLEVLSGKTFDMVIVDGPAYGSRIAMLDHLDMISSNVYLFDDTERTEDRDMVMKFCENYDCTLFDYELFCVVEIEKE